MDQRIKWLDVLAAYAIGVVVGYSFYYATTPFELREAAGWYDRENAHLFIITDKNHADSGQGFRSRSRGLTIVCTPHKNNLYKTLEAAIEQEWLGKIEHTVREALKNK